MSDDRPAEYYKRTVAIPLLDHLLAQLEMRFTHLHQKAFQGLSIIPPILATVTPAEGSRRIQELVDLYQADLPSPGSVNSEVHTWHVRWENKAKDQGPTSLPTTLTTTLSQTPSSMFPNVRTLLIILCTLPVTTCSAERSFIELKGIKTTLRSTMGKETLTCLTLPHMHRDVSVDIN